MKLKLTRAGLAGLTALMLSLAPVSQAFDLSALEACLAKADSSNDRMTERSLCYYQHNMKQAGFK